MKMNDYEKEHIRRLRGEAAQCCLFLKRDGSFPLEEAGPVALYGNGARGTLKGGTGSGDVNSRFVITAERGLERAGCTVTTKQWLDEYEKIRQSERPSFVKRLKAEARAHRVLPSIYGMGAVMPEPEYSLQLRSSQETDTAVYVLSRICGEGSDRRPVTGDIILTHTEIRDILTLQETYEKFLLVLNVGAPVDLLPIAGKVHNILLLSQLGAATGDVLADIILGRANPSGKLTASWAAWEDYPVIGTFGDFDDTYYREGIYVGYRYFNSIGRRVMFPFGFGLSYTDFSITQSSVYTEKSLATVRIKVRNIGKYPGREVAQVYVSCPEGELDQPFQMLAGWAKTGELQPGEEQEVTVQFHMQELSSFDSGRAAYVLEQGDYIVRVGNSSAETKAAAILRLSQTAVTRQVRHFLGDPSFEDWKPGEKKAARYGAAFSERAMDKGRKAEDPGHSIPVLKIDAEDIPYEEAKYPKTIRIDPVVDKMSDEDLACLSVGKFRTGGSIQSVIGSSSFRVPGAAGETTDRFQKAGIPPIVMADGPAGLRLTARYGTDKRGTYSLSDSMEKNYGEFLPAPARKFLGFLDYRTGKRRGDIHEQYATAIPIGTAIAQSWNTDFAEMCGDIVGDEMERFDIGLWLAPALNIQRDIRCGRNFEYFSEDPLVSGKMAAAIVKGVQKHPGRGAVIKHFAANNQETNRYANNSHVSERAMREIYLKGFAICIREADPCAVMTSYNLLNGTHTSERRDLNECILRHEFGFKGMVTTDWVVAGMNSGRTRYRGPKADRVAASGNDIFMPGSKKEYDAILGALKDGSLDRRVVKNNVTRIVKTARMLGDKA